jgi:hypothetical protein
VKAWISFCQELHTRVFFKDAYMVKISVGPDRKLWVLPEQLLCDRVDFFKSVFQSGLQESKEKILELPEDDPTSFAYILDTIFGIDDPQASEFGDSHEDRQLL